MAQFLRSNHNFYWDYVCRGTNMIGAGKLSRYCYFINSTGAVSRYKFPRNQKIVTVQDFNCVQMSVSGCKNHYKFVLGVGAKAKSVTKQLTHIVRVGCSFLFYKSQGEKSCL